MRTAKGPAAAKDAPRGNGAAATSEGTASGRNGTATKGAPRSDGRAAEATACWRASKGTKPASTAALSGAHAAATLTAATDSGAAANQVVHSGALTGGEGTPEEERQWPNTRHAHSRARRYEELELFVLYCG